MPDGRAWLISALADLHPDEPTEAGYLLAYRRLLALPGDVFDAVHYRPGHITASGFVASPDGKSVLLIHHSKLERWLQPGGHVESDDRSLDGAARREVAEETGLTDMRSLGLFDLDIHTFPERGDTPEHLHYDVRFAYQADTDEVAALDGVNEARWVALGDIEELAGDLSVTRPVEKLRRLLR